MPKADSHKDDQPQASDAQYVRFEEFSTLPVGLRKYVASDLIGTPLEDIDPFYKDKQASTKAFWILFDLVARLKCINPKTI